MASSAGCGDAVTFSVQFSSADPDTFYGAVALKLRRALHQVGFAPAGKGSSGTDAGTPRVGSRVDSLPAVTPEAEPVFGLDLTAGVFSSPGTPRW